MDIASVKTFCEAHGGGSQAHAVCRKCHHWDIPNHRKTNVIDSLGIVAERRHHFYDRGHGEVDRGQYDDSLNDVFGVRAVFDSREGRAKTTFRSADVDVQRGHRSFLPPSLDG